MKAKNRASVEHKLLLIKQLWAHKLRFSLLLFSLTFSFVLLLVFVFASFNFGRCTYFVTSTKATIYVYSDQNVSNSSADEKITYEAFAAKVDSAVSRPEVDEAFVYYAIDDAVVSCDEITLSSIPISVLSLDQMRLTYNQSIQTRSMGVKNFAYGGFPQAADEVLINEDTMKKLGLSVKMIKDEKTRITVKGKSYLISGVATGYGFVGDNQILVPLSSVAQEARINSATFILHGGDSPDRFEQYLTRSSLSFEPADRGEEIVNFFILVEAILILMSVAVTAISLLTYYSSVRSLIKESERQICLDYCLGTTRRQTRRDTLFKIGFVSTVSYLIAIGLTTALAFIVATQHRLVFGGIPLYNMLMPSVLGILAGYLLSTGLVVLVFRRPIKKISYKLPSEFGGNA